MGKWSLVNFFLTVLHPNSNQIENIHVEKRVIRLKYICLITACTTSMAVRAASIARFANVLDLTLSSSTTVKRSSLVTRPLRPLVLFASVPVFLLDPCVNPGDLYAGFKYIFIYRVFESMEG